MKHDEEDNYIFAAMSSGAARMGRKERKNELEGQKHVSRK